MKREIQTEITELMKTSSNENIIYQNLLKIFKVLVRRKLKALNMFMNKRMRINELNSQLKMQEQSKPKTRKK